MTSIHCTVAQQVEASDSNEFTHIQELTRRKSTIKTESYKTAGSCKGFYANRINNRERRGGDNRAKSFTGNFSNAFGFKALSTR